MFIKNYFKGRAFRQYMVHSDCHNPQQIRFSILVVYGTLDVTSVCDIFMFNMYVTSIGSKSLIGREV